MFGEKNIITILLIIKKIRSYTFALILGTSDFDHFLELTGYFFIGSHIEGKIFFSPNFCENVLRILFYYLIFIQYFLF